MDKKKTEVGVIIPNRNGKQFLEKCLPSLFNQTYKNFKVLLVDNHSTDNSILFVKENFPSVEVFRLLHNFGFAKAINKGIEKLKTPFIFLLNNDTVLEKDCLFFLVSYLKKHPKVCGVTPKIISMDKPHRIESAGDYINIAGQAFHRGYGSPINHFNKNEEVFLVPGTAALLRRSIVLKVGKFEEKLFAYGEDVDWCLRAQLLGYKFHFVPQAKVFHKGGGTGKKNLKLYHYLILRNALIPVIKNFPFQLFFRRKRFILIPLIHINSFLALCLKGYIKEALKAEFWLLKNLPYFIRKRKNILSKQKVSNIYLDSWMKNKKFRVFRNLRKLLFYFK